MADNPFDWLASQVSLAVNNIALCLVKLIMDHEVLKAASACCTKPCKPVKLYDDVVLLG